MMDAITQQYAKFMSCLKSKKGQTLVEYALLLVLIAIVVILAVQFVGQRTCTVYNNIGQRLVVN